MKKVTLTKNEGTVTVFDGTKNVVFEYDPRDDVEPLDAALLFVDYLELLRSCPRGIKKAAEAGELPLDDTYTPNRLALRGKPKKITLRILEGEKIV